MACLPLSTLAILTSLAPAQGPVPGVCKLQEDQKLLASNAASGDRFGWVAIDGDLALLGADEFGSGPGKAYVFRRVGGSWVEEQVLAQPDGMPGDAFGQTLSIDGDLAVVGAHGHDGFAPDAGASYVYRLGGSGWVLEQKLTASDPIAGHFFGDPGCSGNWLAVGASGDDDQGASAGAVYLFQFDGTQWVEIDKVYGSNTAAGDFFGASLALDGEALIVGAPNGDGGEVNSGTAHVFRRQGLTWPEEQVLFPADSAFGDRFSSVALHGDLALVGAENKESTGVAYVWRHGANPGAAPWTEEQKLVASDGQAQDIFGRRVSIHGSLAVVGASLHDEPLQNAGAAYVFRDTGAGWVEAAKLGSSNAGASDTFGNTSAVFGSALLIGAQGDDSLGQDAGAAFAFELPDLVVAVNGPVLSPGQRLVLSACGGLPGSSVQWQISSINGSPTVTPLGSTTFDAQGRASFRRRVPRAASGLVVEFQAIGFFQIGAQGSSNPVQVTFL